MKTYPLPTQFLVFGSICIGGVCLIAGLMIGKLFFDGFPPTLYQYLFFAFTLVWWIASSIVTIVRREMPIRIGAPGIKGFWAVFIGLIQLIILSSAEIYLLYSAFLLLIS
jgi:hypothetical protein